MGIQFDGINNRVTTSDIVSQTGTFSSDVGIGGTLTYEDVANIDSVGVITARSGINVTSGNLIIGSTSAEAKLDVTGGVSISSNGVTVTPSGYDLKIRSDTAKLGIHIDNASGTPILEFGIGGATGARITTNTSAGPIIIAPNNVERLRIASNGDFGFNDTAPTAHASGNNTVLSIKGKGSSYSGKIDFKDSDGNIDSYINSDNSILQFYADPNSQNGNTLMRFYVHGAERFRFGAAGQFGIGTNYGTAGQVLKSGGASAAPTWGSAGGETTEIYAYISFGTTYDTNSGYVTQDVSSLQSGNGITVDNSNERLTPTVAGKYFVMYMCNWLWSFSGGATFYNRITKNGSEQQRSTFSKYDPGSHTNITMCVMTMNGSSDYVQFQGYENKSGQAAYMGNLSRAVMFKLRD